MITIVSGLPRSGTSMMMQMLAAGGMPILQSDRPADVNNPRGYFEWDGVRELAKNPECIAQAEDKAVKVISTLLKFLPQTHEYRIILMERPLPEVMASMEKMHRNLYPEDEEGARALSSQDFAQSLAALYRQATYWLSTGIRRNGTCSGHFYLHVEYHRLLKAPRSYALWIAGAFEQELDVGAMVRAVDPALYRTRL